MNRKYAIFSVFTIVLLVSLALISTNASSQQSEPAQRAWETLVANAQVNLRNGAGETAPIREVLQDLERFATTHADHDLALTAMLERSGLAAAIEDYQIAEDSLRWIKEHKNDPEIGRAIDFRLARLDIRPGKKPPQFEAPALNGGKLSLDVFKGKVVLLDFWATWCMPCLAELPNVQRTYRKYHNRGFEVIGISLDEDKNRLRGFVSAREMSWHHVYDNDLPQEQRLALRYFVDSIPRTLLVGPDGAIVKMNLRGSALEAEVGKLITKSVSRDKNVNSDAP